MDLKFQNALNCVAKIDSPLTKQPVARWQRKAMEQNNHSINTSIKSCNSSSLSSSCVVSKTPNKDDKRKKLQRRTPGRSKSPGNGGDDLRLIPNRSQTNFDLAQFKLSQQENDSNAGNVDSKTIEYQRAMADNLNGGDINKMKILAYSNKPPLAPENHMNSLKVLYSTSKTPGSIRKTNRFIPQAPERVLDAPDLSDDYYLNLLDWSTTNMLAVALANSVYLWNASTAQIDLLFELENQDDYVSSVIWNPDGSYVSVGLSDSSIQIWDPEVRKRIRTMHGHSARVGCLSWNEHILSSGCKSGAIHHHDVRVAEHLIAELNEHTREVCGLKWSTDGRYLAAGANDNFVSIWSAVPGHYYSETQPLYVYNDHQAAVKGLAWCPWQPNILATGGGTADRCLKIWNCNIGSCISSVNTNSQVCSILWSKEYKELITGHGFANNQLIIWKYPTLTKIAELVGHTSRVLHMALSPDGQIVVSAAGDETLRFWKCFASDPNVKKAEKPVTKAVNNMNFFSIR